MGELYAWASPEAMGRLTLRQLMMYLKSDKRGDAPKNAFRSRAERDAYVAEIRKRRGLD